MTEQHYEIVIVGGGAAGITAAARLAKELPAGSIAIIEPSADHYYQSAMDTRWCWCFSKRGLAERHCNAHT